MSEQQKKLASALQVYEGVPQDGSTVAEASRWQRFLETLLPWLKRKRELADDLLEAEVLKRIADAKKTEAEARKTEAEALVQQMQAAEIAARLDAKRPKAKEVLAPHDPEIQQALNELDEKLNFLKAKYGLTLLPAPDSESDDD